MRQQQKERKRTMQQTSDRTASDEQNGYGGSNEDRQRSI